MSKFDSQILHSRYYLYAKYHFILKNFHENYRLIIATLSMIICLLLFWKIPQNIRNYRKYLEEKDLKQFSLLSTILIIDGFIEVISPVVFIFNHLNPFSCFSLYTAKKYFRNNNFEISFPVLNLLIFINKGFDNFITILSLSRLFSFSFWVFVDPIIGFQKQCIILPFQKNIFFIIIKS
jgi:hypothetical protein